MAHTDLSGDEISGTPTAPSGLAKHSPTPPLAWGVCWLMFASTVLNYMDRQKMSLVSRPIMTEFHLDDVGFGWLISAFLLTYAVCQLPAGYLVDQWDVRKTYAGAVAWWSFAGVAAAFSPTLGALVVFRILLGMGESFNWPCALRTTSLVLPPRDRSLGNGIFNSGAAVGAVLTPYIVSTLTVRYNWRTSFVAVGSLGFIWVVVWLRVMSSPSGLALMKWQKGQAITVPVASQIGGKLSDEAKQAFGAVAASSACLGLLVFWFGAPAFWWAIAWLMFGTLLFARILPASSLAGANWARSLGEIVRLRRFWVLVVVTMTINTSWHSLVNWLPRYLNVDRNMTFLASGLWSSIPFVAADVGNLGGGALSRLYAGQGIDLSRARLTVMAGCTLLITSGAWVGAIQSNLIVIGLLAVMAMATAAFMANYFAFTQEVSTAHTGLIVGILGGLGNLAAAGFIPLAGWIKLRTGGFGPVFVLMGLLPFLGLGALLVGWGNSDTANEAGQLEK